MGGPVLMLHMVSETKIKTLDKLSEVMNNYLG